MGTKIKMLGLVGFGWLSNADYYRYINEGINRELGGMNFASCIMHSFNQGEIKIHMDAGDVSRVMDMIITACKNMERSGAEGLVLCANTMHMFADSIQAQVNTPIIHIIDATAQAIKVRSLKKVGLLGTKPTMELDFYKDRLQQQGIEAMIPGDTADREFIHHTIFDELAKGMMTEETKSRYLDIINKLAERGAEGVILGCTEIPLLIKQEDVTMPVFDTTRIHAEAAIRFSLGKTQYA